MKRFYEYLFLTLCACLIGFWTAFWLFLVIGFSGKTYLSLSIIFSLAMFIVFKRIGKKCTVRENIGETD
jgi:hypothetical protein